jgi:hypothetical protein
MDTRLTCQQIQNQIDQMSQRELRLAADDRGPVHDHVEGCPACKGHLSKALDLACQLDQWKVPAPRRNIVAAVMAEIARDEGHPRPQRITLGEHLASLLRVRVQVPAAAAILIIGALIVSIGMNLIRSTQPVRGLDPILVPAGTTVVKDRTYPAKVVPAQGLETRRPLLVNPALVPGTVIVILGTPPVLPQEITPRLTPTPLDQSL